MTRPRGCGHPTYRPGCQVCHVAATDPVYAFLGRLGESVPDPPPRPAVDVGAYPRLVRWLYRRRRRRDRGAGDTLHAVLGAAGRGFERWVVRLTGKPCGCADRRTRLNELFPYPAEN